MDRAALDRQYSPSSRVTSLDAYLREYERLSEAARRAHPVRTFSPTARTRRRDSTTSLNGSRAAPAAGVRARRELAGARPRRIGLPGAAVAGRRRGGRGDRVRAGARRRSGRHGGHGAPGRGLAAAARGRALVRPDRLHLCGTPAGCAPGRHGPAARCVGRPGRVRPDRRRGAAQRHLRPGAGPPVLRQRRAAAGRGRALAATARSFDCRPGCPRRWSPAVETRPRSTSASTTGW